MNNNPQNKTPAAILVSVLGELRQEVKDLTEAAKTASKAEVSFLHVRIKLKNRLIKEYEKLQEAGEAMDTASGAE